jgi:hypothetical protein
MKKSVLWIAITLVFAVVAFGLSQVIWPNLEGAAEPTSLQLTFFIIYSAVEALAFGFGVAFLILGWPLVRAVEVESKDRAMLVFFSIVWMLASWWPHDNLHRTTMHDDLTRLLYLEFGFHFTLIIAGFILAYAFYHLLKTHVSPKVI